MKLFGKNPDRIDRNDSDAQAFYGFDHDDGTTDWYLRDGTLNSVTKTPRDENDE